jgi:parvulin-like peptidyl-prolyl isomerase
MKNRVYGAILICGLGLGSSLFASDVLVEVNGNGITKSDVNNFIKANQPVGIDLTYDKLRPENKKQIVNGLIDNELMVEAAKKANIEASEAFQSDLESVKKALMVKHWLKQQFDDIIISDSEAKKFYEKIKNSPEKVHARHILVKSEAEAKKIIAKLKSLKGDALKKRFIELAKKMSIGPSGKSGGDLGYFKKEQMVPPFAEASFSLKKGNITTKPIKTQFGWHIIYVEDHQPSKVIPFEKLKDKIVQDLKQKHFKEKVAKDLEMMRRKANIKVIDGSVAGIISKKDSNVSSKK